MENTNTPSTPTFTVADIIKSTDAATHFGVAWSTETVNREPDGNGSTKVEATADAQILSIVDLEKFRANFPNADEILLGIANGTSLRVMAQDVNRRNPKKSRDERRSAIVNRLVGVRNAGVRTVVTKVVEKIVKQYALPNGESYTGTDETEYQQLYLAALVDFGMPVATAQSIATLQKLS